MRLAYRLWGFEKDCIKQIVDMGLKASIMAWNRAVIADIKESIECGVDAVAISISTSDIHIQHKLQTTREDVLARMSDAVSLPRIRVCMYLLMLRMPPAQVLNF